MLTPKQAKLEHSLSHGSYKTKDTGSIISVVLLLTQMVMNNEYDIMIELCSCFPPLWGPQFGNSE